MQFGWHTARLEQARQRFPVIQPDREVGKPELFQHISRSGEDLGLHHHRLRPDGVDITLIELPEPPLLGPVGAPDRLHLVALEELRQSGPVLRDDAGERDREVVSKREIGLARIGALAAFEDLEDELVALFSILAEQRLDVLDGRRLERLEAVALVHRGDHIDDVLPATDVLRQEVAHASRGAGVGAHARLLLEPRENGSLSFM